MKTATVDPIVSRCITLLLAICFVASPVWGMDRARSELRVDQAAADFKATGQGVLVAIMDRGIDWRNDDFRNEDGTTRIQYIFDMTDDAGAQAADNSYKVGTIYTRKQIDHALRGGPKLPTRDAIGHGTTTTAIACGSGRNSPSRKYRGVAPEASLLIIKLVSDGAPAHDGEPAEPAFYQPERIAVAIDFIRDKGKELKMPCAMVLNIGSQGGPTDGTSELCRKIDATVGPGKPGLIFVTGPGDDGGRPNRAGGTIKQGEAVTLKIRKEAETPIRVDLWYAGEDQLDISLRTPGGTFGPFPAPTGDDQRLSQSDKDFTYYHNTGTARFSGPSSRKRQVWVELKGPTGDYVIVLHGRSVKSGRFDATLGPTPPAPNRPPFDRFLSHIAPGSIWDGATATRNICPGDYLIRTEWTDLDGRPQSQANQGKVGELWNGSSVGPTFDGRLGVDCCVPADSVFTTYNPKSYWATFRKNLIGDGNGLYGRASAVSAANPMAAGVIALMLQLDPELDAADAKNILQQAARSDRFTGKTPNPNWGYGKLDAHAALQLTQHHAGTRQE